MTSEGYVSVRSSMLALFHNDFVVPCQKRRKRLRYKPLACNKHGHTSGDLFSSNRASAGGAHACVAAADRDSAHFLFHPAIPGAVHTPFRSSHDTGHGLWGDCQNSWYAHACFLCELHAPCQVLDLLPSLPELLPVNAPALLLQITSLG